MENQIVHSYKDLIVWQRAMDLIIATYELTNSYPQSELYGLVSQTRRAAVSIAANIAEGRRRGSKKDYRKFLIFAYSSGAELETHIEIAKRLSFGANLCYSSVDKLLLETMKMLNRIISLLRD